MRIQREDILSLIIFFTIVIAFFFPLFWPEPKLIVTPDFGTSDAIHDFATKWAVCESIRYDRLPLWTPSIGGGFPLFAEGISGSLFFPMIILCKATDTVTAVNSSLLLSAILMGWGMYIWLRLMRLSSMTGFFAGLTLPLSGIVVTQLMHIPSVHGLSLLPFVGATVWLLVHRPSRRWIGVFALLLSQQLLSGFPQLTFITVLFLFSYLLWLAKQKHSVTSSGLRFLLGLLLAFGVSAVQVLPSWEYLRQTTSTGTFSADQAMFFSFPIKHLVTFLAPFALGNPRIGTYPSFLAFDGSIFWENTGFAGIITVALVSLSFIFFFRTKQKKTSDGWFFFIVLATSFLFMTGKYSPMYFIYSIFPFTLFRVPSKFIILFTLSFVMLAAFGLEIVGRYAKKYSLSSFLVGSLIFLNTAQLFMTWRDYHALGPASEWLVPPKTASYIEKDSRFLTIGDALIHNQIFLTNGWQDTAPYRELLNMFPSHSSILWNLPRHAVHTARPLHRVQIFDELLGRELNVTDKGATPSAYGEKLLNIASIGTVLTTVPLTPTKLRPTITLPFESFTLGIFENRTRLPRAYLATNTHVAKTTIEAWKIMQSDSFIVGKSVLLETPLSLNSNGRAGKATVTDASSTHIIVHVKDNETDAVLVLGDTYYPGWKATIDGKKTEIFPANIRQRGVFVPPGNHTVDFVYQPGSVQQGTIVSVFSILMTIALLL